MVAFSYYCCCCFPFFRAYLIQVMQDDLLNGYLTVWETLSYTGDLRLPPSMTEQERNVR